METQSSLHRDVRNPEYIPIVFSGILYIIFSLLQGSLPETNEAFMFYNRSIPVSTLRGILAQLQMLLSISLVLRESIVGYRTALALNMLSATSAIIFLLRFKSTSSLPGLISYLAVTIIVRLINDYKIKKSTYINEIEIQKAALEESDKKLYHMAYYDSLTDLPNRALFVNRLEKSIKKAQSNSALIGVLFFDLDSFKTINDSLGHTAGDESLRLVSQRILSQLSDNDSLCRFSGDEFLIQITELKMIGELHDVCNKIIDVFQEPFHLKGQDFYASASVGAAVYPADGKDAETLIKNADIAMYTAKRQGKDQYVISSARIKEEFAEETILTNRLYTAIDNNELYLNYQPQIKVATQEIVGLEALLRWNNTALGIIPPNVFIPLAEKTGLIKPIGLWVFQTVCKDYQRYREIAGRNIRIAINLSIGQLRDTDIISQVEKILLDTGTSAEDIQIELTESTAFNEDPFILQRIIELKELGFTIAIDDFGTGHSSLSRLKSYPIDLIKIDMDFVQGISRDSGKDKAIIKSIIQMSENLGIEVLAEGVETEEQLSYLKSLECDEIQGFYFYKPMSYEDVTDLLMKAKR